MSAENTMPPESSAQQPLSAVEKAVTFLHIVAEADNAGLGVTEIAKTAGLPKGTSHRILKTLAEAELLYFDDATKSYTLGSNLLNFGLAAMRQLDVPRLARPYLLDMAHRTEETATLSMRQGDMRVYLDQVPSTQEIKMTVPIGIRFPLYAGSSSKAILSTLEDDELEAYIDSAELRPITDATILNRDVLRAEVEEARILGYTTSRGERERDAGSIAAPVRGAGGDAFGSISVCGPIQRFDRNGTRALGRMVKEHADQLSAEIGYRA